MKYGDIQKGMTLKLKADRQQAYGLPTGTVHVLGLKDRDGYKVGHVFAAYIDTDTYGTREMSGYFKPSDFLEGV